MTRRSFVLSAPLALAVAQKSRAAYAGTRPPQRAGYSGPRPPQKDLLYLLQADHLIATEAAKVSEVKSKDSPAFTVPGVTSTARTPLPEPIFLLSPTTLQPEKLTLLHLQVKDGQRQASPERKSADDDADEAAEDLRLTLRKLDDTLYRIEATHMLAPGEYALFAQGSNAFCFTVY